MKLTYSILYIALSLTSIVSAQVIEQNSIDSHIKTYHEFYLQGKYGDAIEGYDQLLKYGLDNDNLYLYASANSGLGNTYSRLQKDSLAVKYLLESEKAFIELKDTLNIINISNDIGAHYTNLEEVEISHKYYQKAIELADKKNLKNLIVYPLSNISGNEIYYNENYDFGIKNAERALILADSIEGFKNDVIKSYIYKQLAYAHFKKGNQDKHKLYSDLMERYSKENEFLYVLSKFYDEQSILYEENEQFKESLFALIDYVELTDSLNTVQNYEKAKQIEVDNELRENNEKLKLIEQEKRFQGTILEKTRDFNILLTILSILLILGIYYIYKKNKQLNIAKKSAEKLSKAKSNFYSEMSHELRTPLYAVIELSNLLLKENVSSKHKEYLESLKFSGNHLLSLVNNVLELNKVESGSIKLEMLNFNLKSLINNIIESLEYAIKDSNNKLHLNYDDNIPKTLVGDSLKLTQVLINLASNAIKFTRHGNINITIKLVEKLEHQANVLFEIKDDGVGIAKDKLIKIFEDFYQEEQINKDKSYKGTGLGLSIVKRTLDAMDTSIAVDSEINKGTTFSFQLIFETPEISEGDNVVDHQDIKSKIIGKRVLVVDDNRINRLVTKKILNQFQMNIEEVSSGQKALDLLKKETFDCVLMDLHMPGLDGYETTKLIREFNTEIPIIALTAASTEEIESKIDYSIMNDYIMKPFKTSDFLETLNKAI